MTTTPIAFHGRQFLLVTLTPDLEEGEIATPGTDGHLHAYAYLTRGGTVRRCLTVIGTRKDITILERDGH